MAEPFRDFAAITNPPETWAEAHAKIAEGCDGFADALEGLGDNADGLLDGAMTAEDYNRAVAEYTAGLTEAAAQLTEEFGMMELQAVKSGLWAKGPAKEQAQFQCKPRYIKEPRSR